jgi:uncharacterized membrane protein
MSQDLNVEGRDAAPESLEEGYSLKRLLREDWPLWLLLALAFAAALWIYPRLPDRVPVHWNIHGQVDNWGSRFWATFGLLAFLAGIYALVALVPFVDPRRANYAKFLSAHRLIRWGTVLTFVAIWGCTTAVAAGQPMPIERIVPGIIGLLFAAMGNIMGRLRYNWFVGIRTPWSMANEEAWRLTHRASGPVWVLSGIGMLIGAFLGGVFNFVMMMIGIFVPGIFSVAYSYVAYRRSQPKN